MTNKFLKSASVLYAAVAFGLTAIFILFSTQCYYGDSEIWLLTLSQNVMHTGDLITIYYKWIFHIFIYLFSHGAPTELDVFTWARLGCSLVGLAAAGITARVFTQAFGTRQLYFPLFIFIFTSSLYFNQAFRIRADIFSYFFHIATVWFLLSMRQRTIRWYHSLLLILLNAALFLSGPKMIYFFIAQFMLATLLVSQTKPVNKKQFFWFVWIGHFCGLALVTFVGAATFLFRNLPSAPLALSLAVDFFIAKFGVPARGPAFFSIYSFQYLARFLASSWLHVSILSIAIVGFATQHLRKNRNSESSLPTVFFFYSLLLVIFALAHNDKLPFFLAPMLTPILAWSFLYFYTLLKVKFPQFTTSTLFVIIAICSYQAITFFELSNYLNTNFYQRSVISQLDTYVKKNANPKVYDVIGLLPRKNNMFIFVGPSEENEKQNLVDSIKAQDPDVFIYTYKAKDLEPQLGFYLTSTRIPVEKDVWTKGRKISLQETPELFQTTKKFSDGLYWVLPVPPEKYLYDLRQGKMINGWILRLDQNYVPTKKTPAFIGIPMDFIFVGLSNFGPPEFIAPPSEVFRFDTGF
jgi:hypothetical protein